MENDEIELHPEYIRLINKYNTMREEFVKLIEQREHIIVSEIPTLDSEYKVKIGGVQYQCFNLEIEVLAIKREIKLRQAALNRDIDIEDSEIKNQIEKELEQWRKKVNEMKEEFLNAKKYLNIPYLSDEDSIEFKKLYRNLAKKLHPDVIENSTNEKELLWFRVQEAYKLGDIEELKSIYLLSDDMYDEVMTNTKSENVLSALEKKISDLEKSIFKVIEQIKNLNSKFPMNLKYKLRDINWVKSANSDINNKMIELNKEKKIAEAILMEFK